MGGLKRLLLANCNVEWDRHIQNVQDFLRNYSPDVVCFQEAIKENMDDLAREFNYHLAFRDYALLSKDTFDHLSSDKVIGLSILSRIPIYESGSYTYFGDENSIPIYQQGKPNSVRRELLYAFLNDNFRIATTHFTWSPDGEVTEEQQRDVKVLIERAKLLGECVLTGDFNAPRPNEIYQTLTKQFHDDIPSKYSSSLDPNLHRVGNNKKLLVDYIFSTPAYEVTDVKFIEGISDHKAILAQVERKSDKIQ